MSRIVIVIRNRGFKHVVMGIRLREWCGILCVFLDLGTMTDTEPQVVLSIPTLFSFSFHYSELGR
jgi:hypothetical protein